ncbi:hypothetical protein FQZ97_812670 [compost metagenome]
MTSREDGGAQVGLVESRLFQHAAREIRLIESALVKHHHLGRQRRKRHPARIATGEAQHPRCRTVEAGLTHHDIVERRVVELCTAKPQSRGITTVKGRQIRIGMIKHSARQPAAVEHTAFHTGAGQVGARKIGLQEYAAGKIHAAKIQPLQFGIVDFPAFFDHPLYLLRRHGCASRDLRTGFVMT